jgi:hypothetical protein
MRSSSGSPFTELRRKQAVASLWTQRRPLRRLAQRVPGELFTDVDVERWDAPLLELPTRAAVRDYLIAKGADAGVAEAKAEAVAVPLVIAKRGAIAFGRKG